MSTGRILSTRLSALWPASRGSIELRVRRPTLVRAVALHPAEDLWIESIAELALDEYAVEIVESQE
jgi:hypothetical protein